MSGHRRLQASTAGTLRSSRIFSCSEREFSDECKWRARVSGESGDYRMNQSVHLMVKAPFQAVQSELKQEDGHYSA